MLFQSLKGNVFTVKLPLMYIWNHLQWGVCVIQNLFQIQRFSWTSHVNIRHSIKKN